MGRVLPITFICNAELLIQFDQNLISHVIIMGNPPSPRLPKISSQNASPDRVPRVNAIKPWAFEVAVLGLALGAFATIVVILWVFNGEQSPAWRYSINLNSLVAILSTVLRAALMVPVAACAFSHLLQPCSMWVSNTMKLSAK